MSGSIVKTYPCDESLRLVLRDMREKGEITNGALSRVSMVNESIISQYLATEGNKYDGDIAKYEAKFRYWLEKRDLEKMGGIPTIRTSITEQVESAARMLRRCGIMGKGIGKSGIGKTRALAWLVANDPTIYGYFTSGKTGRRELLEKFLQKKVGLRGVTTRTDVPREQRNYLELVKRLREAEPRPIIIIDQAHRLNSPALDFLTELWNDTGVPIMLIGTRALIDKLERDEQWASRTDFTFELKVIVDEKDGVNEVRPIVEHQLKNRLPDLNGEEPRLIRLCEGLARRGSFRRVEMRLTTMLYLRDSVANHGKSWADLFEQAGNFLTEIDTED